MSRKITQNAVNAFLRCQYFNESNTQVLVGSNNTATLILFGNNIAFLNADKTVSITNAGYFTNTTKERLNGIPNVHIQQKKGLWYLNGKEWDGSLINVGLIK